MNYSTIEISGNVITTNSLVINGDIKVAIGGGGGEYPYYQGEYTVTPRVYEQYLYTDNKILTDDVTVLKIPKSEVENIQNGLTVTIG